MKDEKLREGTMFFMYLAIVALMVIMNTHISAQVDDVQASIDNGGQVYAEKLNALRTDYTALLEENEMLKDSYADMAGNVKAVNEILKQLTYETILVEPEATDIWLQTCVDFLEVK